MHNPTHLFNVSHLTDAEGCLARDMWSNCVRKSSSSRIELITTLPKFVSARLANALISRKAQHRPFLKSLTSAVSGGLRSRLAPPANSLARGFDKIASSFGHSSDPLVSPMQSALSWLQRYTAFPWTVRSGLPGSQVSAASDALSRQMNPAAICIREKRRAQIQPSFLRLSRGRRQRDRRRISLSNGGRFEGSYQA